MNGDTPQRSAADGTVSMRPSAEPGDENADRPRDSFDAGQVQLIFDQGSLNSDPLRFTPSALPAWLLILILMELVIVVINPSPKDFLWYMGLRRPQWLRFFIWIPLIWLVISASLYFSALISWESSNNWRLLLIYLVLLAVLESHTLLLCQYRNLRLGAGALLVGWIYALVLAINLLPIDSSRMASQLLLPLLIWAPIEAYALERMRRLNRC